MNEKTKGKTEKVVVLDICKAIDERGKTMLTVCKALHDLAKTAEHLKEQPELDRYEHS